MQLVQCLRRWPNDRLAAEPEIGRLLEGYMGECLPYGPNALRDWWCDGVAYLEIEQTSTDAFKLLGVAWITASALAPFELDVELKSTGEPSFAKTIFRIGTRDRRGRPQFVRTDADWRTILRERPQRNCDWAMAIELTPAD